ncbi:MAG TPA: ATP-binding protein [Roseiflexaceae bacterium]|nr:ATP-binding protein [Roseiflexaceae bacterium]
MLQRLPLQQRLALAYSVFFALVLLLLSSGVYLAVRQALLRELAEQLTTSSRLIEEDFLLSNAELGDYFSAPAPADDSRETYIDTLDTPALFVQTGTPDGVVTSRSKNMGDQQFLLPHAQLQATLAGTPQTAITMLGTTRVLVYSRVLRVPAHPVVVLEVGHSLRDLDRILQLLLISLLVIGGVALAASIRAGMWLTSRALEPVADIAHAAQQIVSADDLARRVPEVSSNDPIGELTTTTNTMLARLEQLFTAQQRLVADVSHELRTPLAAMRGHIEVLRRGGARDSAMLDASLADLEREAARLARLTNDLLTLAEVESGNAIFRTPVALDDLVLEVVRELQPLTDGVSLVPQITEQVELIGDRDRLKQALLNLVANALQHTAAGGSVRVVLARDDATALLCVEDSGAGIAPHDLPHVFERFYRADNARSRAVGGAGLGLAIVEWVASAHGGSVDVHSTVGQGSTFTIRLPLAANNANIS